MNSDTRYVRRKTLLNRSGVEWTDYNCNHYIGCWHGCNYPCYAQKISRQKYPYWRQVAVVKNALELAVREIRKVPPGARIMVSSMTDPYQPIEETEKLTRSLLPVLAIKRWEGIPDPPTIIITTKSDLVRRDFQLIKQFPNIKLCMTITSCDNLDMVEPYAPGNCARIACLRDAHRLGIYTIASIEPWIPGVSKPLQIVRHIYPYVDEIFIGSLNHHYINGSEAQKRAVRIYREYLPLVVDFLQRHMKKVVVKRELAAKVGIRNMRTQTCREDTGQKEEV